MRIKFKKTKITLFGGKDYFISGTIDLNPGGVVFICGENGSGKTLTLNLLSSIIENRDNGFIKKIDRDNIEISEEIYKNLGSWVHQEPRDNFISRNSSDEIILPFLSQKLTRDEMVERITGLIRETDILDRDFFQKRISQLSSGEKQKIAILVALANNPSFLFLDEPLSRLDGESRKIVCDLVNQKKEGKTLIISTHFPEYMIERLTNFSSNIYEIDNDGLNIHIQEIELTKYNANSYVKYSTIENLFFNELISDEYREFSIPHTSVRFYKGGGDKKLFQAKLIDLYAGKSNIAQSSEPVLSYGLNLGLGKNGSGKTSFGSFFTGRIRIDPWITPKNSIFAKCHMNGHVDLKFNAKGLRRKGDSYHIHGEPDLFLSERTVFKELQLFNNHEKKASLDLLKSFKINIESKIDELSYGQKRAVVLAAIPEKMELVIIDEPFIGFSQKSAKIVRQFIFERVKRNMWKSCLLMLNNLAPIIR